MNLTDRTDDQLTQLRDDVVAELNRRERLATVPALVAELAERYTSDGGNPADLAAAITEPPQD